MIARVAGWSWEVAGDAVRLVHPRGPAAGVLRYRERVTPIRSLQALLGDRDDPAFVAHASPQVTPFLTDEGEYAVRVAVSGVRAGAPLHRVLAVVFGDDWYAELSGVASSPSAFAALTETVRTVAVEDRLMLGHPRRRRFDYAPPPGWSSYAPLPLTACWFPPGYPADDQLITVYPATPHGGDLRLELGALPFGPPLPATVLDEAAGMIELSIDALVGRQWAFHVRTDRGLLIRLIALLRSSSHYYCLLGDARADTLPALTRQFVTLRDSIRALPAPRLGRSQTLVAFEPWGEL